MERDDAPLDAEMVAGIINLLMRIDARLEELLEPSRRMTMKGKKMTAEQRAKAARILNEIRSDLRELRVIFERLQARLQRAD